MAVIDFQRFAQRAALRAEYRETLSARDMQALRRAIWSIMGSRRSEAWLQAIWFALRRACDTPSPLPFALGDMPAITRELRRIGAAAYELSMATADVETIFLRRVVRAGDDSAPIVVQLRTTLMAVADAEAAEVEVSVRKWLEAEIRAFADRTGGLDCYPHHDMAEPGAGQLVAPVGSATSPGGAA